MENLQRPSIYFAASLLLSFLLALLMPDAVFEGDVHWWKEWSKYIYSNGLSAAYTSSDINYQPGLLYVLKIYGGICRGDVENNIILLKQLFFVFDVLAVLLAGCVLIHYHRSPYWSWLILLNPGYLYNTFLWGQCDSIYMFFCMLAVVLITLKRPYLTIVAFAAAILSKPQAIFMGPFLLMLYFMWWKEDPRRFIKSFFVFMIALSVISLPFILHGEGMQLLTLTFGAVDRLPSISMHAYNLWYLLIPGKDLVWEPDNRIFLFLTLRNWGLLMFLVSLIFTLRPIVALIRSPFFTPAMSTRREAAIIFLTFAMCNLVFFFFNTQMHERYIHAALLLMGVYSLLQRDYLPFVILSCSYFLNLDHLLHHAGFPEFIYKAVLPYHPVFIALLNLIVLIWSWKRLYDYKRTADGYNSSGLHGEMSGVQ